MEKTPRIPRAAIAVVCALALPAAAGLALAQPAHAATPKETVEMHRLYNPNSGEHFYTATTITCPHACSHPGRPSSSTTCTT